MQVQKIASTAAATSATSTALTPTFSGAGGGAVAALAPVGSVGSLGSATTQAPQPAPPAPPLAAPVSPSPFLEPGLQQQVSAGQQAQAWLDSMGQQLQGLKDSLAGLLGGGTTLASTTAALQQVRAGWQQRSTQAGGLVDGQLRVMAQPGQARQAFTLRGLDAAALTQEGQETLSFAVPGTPTAINVAIDPEQGAQAAAQRLDQAMAPAGLRVAISAGNVVWSAGEGDWPALREGLSVKGEGRRFPSGQRVRVRLDALPDAIQPGGWSLDGTAAQRQTLARVIVAQGQLRETAGKLADQQAATRLPPPADAAGQGVQLLGVAEDFKAQASAPDYERFAALAPALRSLRRDQVRALLLGNKPSSV